MTAQYTVGTLGIVPRNTAALEFPLQGKAAAVAGSLSIVFQCIAAPVLLLLLYTPLFLCIVAGLGLRTVCNSRCLGRRLRSTVHWHSSQHLPRSYLSLH